MPVKGRIIVSEKFCKGCELCVNACPQKSIHLALDRITPRGYHPAEVLPERCTGCGSCAVVCPEAAITVYRQVVQRAESELLIAA